MKRLGPFDDRQPDRGFPVEAFERLAIMEPGHYWFEARNQLIIWAIGKYFPGAATLLEIGCGTGFVLKGIHDTFPNLHLTASDPMAAGLAIARQRVPSATFIQQDGRELDAVEQFDVVAAFDVLEHITDDALVMKLMHKAVRPGGGVIVTVPQHPQLWSGADEYGRHVRRYRRAELVDKMKHAGFDVVRVTSFVSLLLPLLAASRWVKATKHKEPWNREFHVSPRVSRTLGVVLGIERRAIQSGVCWPAGGSLLLVARKNTR